VTGCDLEGIMLGNRLGAGEVGLRALDSPNTDLFRLTRRVIENGAVFQFHSADRKQLLYASAI